MSTQGHDEESQRNARAYRQLDLIREIGLVFAIVVTGIKLIFSGPVHLRLGDAGRTVQITTLPLVALGALCLLSAVVIAVQHVPERHPLLPPSHLLRRRAVVWSAWAVAVAIVLFVVLTVSGSISAA